MKKNIEKRKCERHEVSEEVTVVTPFSVGQLINVSSGGMSFKGFCSDNVSELFSLDVLAKKGNYYGEKVLVKIVWEKKVPHSHSTHADEKIIGVEFMDTTQVQQIQLEKSLMDRRM